MNIPETFFSVNEEVFLFLISCLFGVAVGVCYDVFRTARIIFPHNIPLVVIEDVIFLSGYAIFLSSFSSAMARGEMRFYYVIGNFIGFIFYFFTLGTVVVGAMRKIFSAVNTLLSVVLKPFGKIYASVCGKIHSKDSKNHKNSVKTDKKSSALLPNKVNLLYNKIENKKRKNVKNVAEKTKTKAEGQKPV